MKVVKTLKGDWRSQRNFGCTYCGWPLDNFSGESGEKTTLEYPFRAPMEALCTPAACWNARKTSRKDMQILGPASRVARRGWEKADLPIRRTWLEGYTWTDMREGGVR